MKDWREQLKFDPLGPLLSSQNQAVRYFARRDLLDETVEPIQELWCLPQAQKILLRRQGQDGAWEYPGRKMVVYPEHHYYLVETWKQFRFLVEEYEFNKEHPSAEKAAEFLFSCQTEEGDIRGMLANQYATYYTGAIMGLLIKAGYEDDPRIERGFQWLLSMRQDDMGWSVPIITHKLDGRTKYRLTSQYADPIAPDRSKPFSHNATGMVLRAFAAHKRYRKSPAAVTAANLLKSRFFKPDCYTSYQAADYWVRFQYPFWWNNLVAALDSISLIGLSIHDEEIRKAMLWLIDHQQESGLWKTSYVKGRETETAKTREAQSWVSFAICRVFKRLWQ